MDTGRWHMDVLRDMRDAMNGLREQAAAFDRLAVEYANNRGVDYLHHGYLEAMRHALTAMVEGCGKSFMGHFECEIEMIDYDDAERKAEIEG